MILIFKFIGHLMYFKKIVCVAAVIVMDIKVTKFVAVESNYYQLQEITPRKVILGNLQI